MIFSPLFSSGSIEACINPNTHHGYVFYKHGQSALLKIKEYELMFEEHIRNDVLLDKAKQSISDNRNCRQPQHPDRLTREFLSFSSLRNIPIIIPQCIPE